MSWRYLPELVGDYSLQNGCLDGERSVMSNGTTIAPDCSKPAFETASLMTRPSGMMPERSMGDPGLDLWMSSLLASRASHSRTLASDGGKTTRAICGPIVSGSFARYDQDSHSWRTFQVSFLLDTTELYSATWPRAGMMLGGVCYRQPSWERRIGEIESGLWRTPNSQVVDAKSSVLKLNGGTPQDPQVGLPDQVIAAERGHWPTPRANDAEKRGDFAYDLRTGLPAAVKFWPTPTRSDATGGPAYRKPPNRQGGPLLKELTRGGRLNPDWEEWLMGWPIGMTALRPLAMESFQRWLRAFGGY